ncbi:hypothetical protein PSHT_09294, partial [Puccinia striiformis]
MNTDESRVKGRAGPWEYISQTVVLVVETRRENQTSKKPKEDSLKMNSRKAVDDEVTEAENRSSQEVVIKEKRTQVKSSNNNNSHRLIGTILAILYSISLNHYMQTRTSNDQLESALPSLPLKHSSYRSLIPHIIYESIFIGSLSHSKFSSFGGCLHLLKLPLLSTVYRYFRIEFVDDIGRSIGFDLVNYLGQFMIFYMLSITTTSRTVSNDPSNDSRRRTKTRVRNMVVMIPKSKAMSKNLNKSKIDQYFLLKPLSDNLPSSIFTELQTANNRDTTSSESSQKGTGDQILRPIVQDRLMKDHQLISPLINLPYFFSSAMSPLISLPSDFILLDRLPMISINTKSYWLLSLIIKRLLVNNPEEDLLTLFAFDQTQINNHTRQQLPCGKVHWFNTILLSRPELEKAFEHNRMINRTTKFAILGMSLSSLLDINSLQDFLKAMTTLLSEFEAMPTDNYKPKISSLSRGIFKQSSKSARKSAGGTDYSITLQDSGDPSFIYTPNIPFDLDYFEVWITLSDILVEVYQKMIKFISTSTTTMPTNSLSTNSVSPVVTSSSTLPSTTIPAPPSTLTGQDSITLPVPPTRSSSNYSIVSVHQTYLNSSHIDLITRIDSKLKKLIVVMTKEIDHLARNAIRDELTNLDPMLLSSTYPVPSSSSSTSYTIPDPNHTSNINEWD